MSAMPGVVDGTGVRAGDDCADVDELRELAKVGMRVAIPVEVATLEGA